MKNWIQKIVRQTLSRFRYKDGIDLDKYYKNIFDNKFNITYDNLKSIVELDSNIQINHIKDKIIIFLKPEYYSTDEFLENQNQLYNYEYLKNLFRDEAKNNKLVLLIYKLIVDSEVLSYTEISNLLKKTGEKELDIKQVAHYCKDLRLYNLINISLNPKSGNERLIKKKRGYRNLS